MKNTKKQKACKSKPRKRSHKMKKQGGIYVPLDRVQTLI